MTLALARGFGYRYPDASRPALEDISLEIEPGTFTVLAGVSGSGKSTLLRALCGLVPHFHGGEASGELHVGGLDVREHGPGELAARLRDGLPGAGDADRDERGARGARAAARAPPRARRGRGPRGRGDGARPRGGAPARAPHRDALGRRAPARCDRRGDGPFPGAAPARRADLAARPGRGRRARLAPAAPQRGLRDGGRDGRAPPRALPARRRQGDRHGGGPNRLRFDARRLPRLGECRRPCARDTRRAPVLAGRPRAAAGHGQGGAHRARAGRSRRGGPAHARAGRPSPAAAPALAARARARARPERRLARGRRRAGRAAGRLALVRAGRARGAHGPQRGGQEHAAAGWRRDSRSRPAAAPSARARWRCCFRTRATT